MNYSTTTSQEISRPEEFSAEPVRPEKSHGWNASDIRRNTIWVPYLSNFNAHHFKISMGFMNHIADSRNLTLETVEAWKPPSLPRRPRTKHRCVQILFECLMLFDCLMVLWKMMALLLINWSWWCYDWLILDVEWYFINYQTHMWDSTSNIEYVGTTQSAFSSGVRATWRSTPWNFSLDITPLNANVFFCG